MFEWLGSILGHELFGTTISVLELTITFVGVATGGFAGGRAAAIARMRLEDRRRLLDGLLNTAKEDSGPHSATVVVERLDPCANLVQLLSLSDRVLWRDVEDSSLYRLGLASRDARAEHEALVKELELIEGGDWDHPIKHAPPELLPAGAQEEADRQYQEWISRKKSLKDALVPDAYGRILEANAQFNSGRLRYEYSTYSRRLNRFEGHLRRQLGRGVLLRVTMWPTVIAIGVRIILRRARAGLEQLTSSARTLAWFSRH